MVDTSRIARQSINVEEVADKVLYLIQRRPSTCDEIEAAENMLHQTVSSAITKLKRDDRIFETGETRPTRTGRPANVYQAVGATPQLAFDLAKPKPEPKVLPAVFKRVVPHRAQCDFCNGVAVWQFIVPFKGREYTTATVCTQCDE